MNGKIDPTADLTRIFGNPWAPKLSSSTKSGPASSFDYKPSPYIRGMDNLIGRGRYEPKVWHKPGHPAFRPEFTGGFIPAPQLLVPPNMPVMPPTPMELRLQSAFESCSFKSTVACIGGAVLGVPFALFTTWMNPSIEGIGTEKIPTVRETLKEMGGRIKTYSRSFAVLGFFFAGTECLIESYTGQTKLANCTMTGAILGGLGGLRVGIVPACTGAFGFACFSTAIDYYMRYRD